MVQNKVTHKKFLTFKTGYYGFETVACSIYERKSLSVGANSIASVAQGKYGRNDVACKGRLPILRAKGCERAKGVVGGV